MKKVVYFLSIIIIIILSVIFFLFRNDFTLSQPLSIDSSKCNVLQNNGVDKINIVFLSSSENAIKFSDYLFSVEPYKSMRSSFNIYYVDVPVKCELYKGVAVFCYSKNTVKLASVCPSDYVIAVKDGYDSSVRSATYMNFVTINPNNDPLVVPHEFSHALANLADEYVPATPIKGAPNCLSKCNSFSDSSSCYLGCSKNNLFRSIDYGIMRSLTAQSFGDFDSTAITFAINGQLEKISSKKGSALTGHAVSDVVDCSQQTYYLVDGHFDNGVMIIDGKSREVGCLGNNGFGVYDYDLVLNNGESYTDGSFNPELIITENQPFAAEQIVGEDFFSDSHFFLKIPIVNDAKSLVISDSSGDIVSSIILNDDNSRFCKI